MALQKNGVLIERPDPTTQPSGPRVCSALRRAKMANLQPIGINDHAHYMNVFAGAQWTGWQPVPRNGTTNQADAAALYLGDLDLFGIGSNDLRHYVNAAALARYNQVGPLGSSRPLLI